MPWETATIDSQILAVHAAVLPNNKVLYFGGSEHNPAQNESGNVGDVDNTRLFNVADGTVTRIASPTTDVFCSGHAFLADGRLLVGGGTEEWGTEVGGDPDHPHALNFGGHKACWLYRPRAGFWRRVADMRFEPGRNTGGGRWYPTLLTLANGEVLAVSGHPSRTDSRHENTTPERYSPGANRWSLLTAQPVDLSSAFYPRIYLLPNGLVFFSSQVTGNKRLYNPYTGVFEETVISPPGEHIYDHWDATGVMLPLLPKDNHTPRILVCGAPQPRRITLAPGNTKPLWKNAGTRTGAAKGSLRQFACSVILPTGQVFISGGVSVRKPEKPVLEPEIYTPAINWETGTYAADEVTNVEKWESKLPADVTRNYHSVALLLLDGRVWTAGSSKNADPGNPDDTAIGEKRIEIYRPDYLDPPNQPQITNAPPSVGYGETFEVRTPQAADIQRVALIRCGSVTHAFDADQRYVGLLFSKPGGDRLVVTAPPHSGVAPPGNYMLWVVDKNGRPCVMARIIRVAAQGCFIIADRSTFSTFEAQALLGAGPARFADSFYVVMDGFLPHEIGPPPTVTFTRPDNSPVPGLTAELNQTLYEIPYLPSDIQQRVTYSYTARFDSIQAFNEIAAGSSTQTITMHAKSGTHACQTPLVLTKNPNPYMRDGQVHWLSVDLRVFQMKPGWSRANITHGSSTNAPFNFLQSLLNVFNGWPAGENHPFFGISTNQTSSRLELATHDPLGNPVFNYAVAKVRYRAPAGSVAAADVRMIFRLFTTATANMEFDPSTYPLFGIGKNAKPLLGLAGNQLVSIPCFAAPRAADLSMQSDPLNVRTLNPAGAQESHAYFGCWLDFNQTTPRFPLYPTDNAGPFTGSLKSIQELIRGRHQCFVAEIHFPPDPIPHGATPGSSDNLSQRNLVIVESDNPGSAATHTVQHTFEVKPSPVPLGIAKGFFGLGSEGFSSSLTHGRQGGSDELIIRWNNLPPETIVRLYLPDVDVNHVIAAAGSHLGEPVLSHVDDHTLMCKVGEITYIPLPGPRDVNIPALISLQLPPDVKSGQVYTATVQQYSGFPRRIIGSFQITIPVSTGPLMLATEIHNLSVLRHIALSIPVTDRWHPIFVRYLEEIADRVRGLGFDPDGVEPSPGGDGGGILPTPEGAGKPGRDHCDCRMQWLFSAVLAPLLVLIGVAPIGLSAPLAALGVVLLVAVVCYWRWRCRLKACDLIAALLLGFGIAGVVLSLVALLGPRSPGVLLMLALTGLVTGLLIITALLGGCWGQCWCLIRQMARVQVPPAPPPQREFFEVDPDLQQPGAGILIPARKVDEPEDGETTHTHPAGGR